MGISKIKPDSKFSPQSRTGDSLIQKCSLKMGPAGTSKNKCPTNIASKVYAWDDGWMDGWMTLPPSSSQGRAYEQLLEYYTHHKLPSCFTCGCVLHICGV